MKTLLAWVWAFGVSSVAIAADPVVWPRFAGPNADFTLNLSPTLTPTKILWKTPLGLGESSIVGDGERLYTVQGQRNPQDPTQGTETVLALNPDTGKPVWEHTYEVTGLPKGDTPVKGGKSGPQASVCVMAGVVVSCGYTGRVFALNAKTGAVVWSKDLVKDFGGVAPEFGFSSSPVPYGQVLLLPVGGTKTALVALTPNTGQEVWRTEADRASYCTPQAVTLSGVPQIVHETRNRLNGYDPATGKTLWSTPLPLEGLTNVPSPLVFPDGRIIISGQGVKGTKMVKVTLTQGQWTVTEVWKSSPEFFYCNWGVKGDLLFGCSRAEMVALSLKDGEVAATDKTLKDANLVFLGQTVILQRRDAALVTVELTETGVKQGAVLELNGERTWTPPSVVGRTLYVRTKTELVAVALGPGNNGFVDLLSAGVPGEAVF